MNETCWLLFESTFHPYTHDSKAFLKAWKSKPSAYDLSTTLGITGYEAQELLANGKYNSLSTTSTINSYTLEEHDLF